MKKISLFFLMLMCFQLLKAQELLPLDICLQAAEKAFPAINADSYYEQIRDLNKEAHQASWYPALKLNAQLSYQSEVTYIDLSDLPFSIDIPSPSKDQYKASVDIQQQVWDGGMNRKLKEIDHQTCILNKRQTAVELYAYKENVCNIYLNILLLQKQQQVLALSMETLKKQIEKVKSAVKNGVVLQSEADVLQAEIIQMEKNLLEADYGEAVLKKSLGVFCGMEIQSETELMDDFPIKRGYNGRPENEVFSQQLLLVERNADLLKVKRMPMLYAFGQLGYGKPGLNFMSDAFGEYYVFGAGLSWTIWDWNQNRKEREALLLQKEIIRIKENSFDQIIMIAIEKELSQEEMFAEMIRKDVELITLRENIRKTSMKQLEEGVITATDYLVAFNAEKMARLNLELNTLKEKQTVIKREMLFGNL
jgi:outer membrane protein TolC